MIFFVKANRINIKINFKVIEILKDMVLLIKLYLKEIVVKKVYKCTLTKIKIKKMK